MYTRGVIFYEEDDDDLDVVPKSPPKKKQRESFEKDMALLSFLVVFWHLVDQKKKRERSFSFLKRKDRSIIDSKHFGRGA